VWLWRFVLLPDGRRHQEVGLVSWLGGLKFSNNSPRIIIRPETVWEERGENIFRSFGPSGKEK
jgi:hypothetical protein